MTWWKRLRRGNGPESDFGALVEGTEDGSLYAYESLVHHLIATAVKRRPDDEEVKWLRGQDASTWRRIEAAPRDHRLYEDVYPLAQELQKLLGADCSTLLAVMASFHRSGYVREAAVDILTTRQDALSDNSLALRTSDWVDVVRQKARSAVLNRIDRRHALSIVPLLVATLDQDRSQGLLDEYLARLDSETVGDLARFGSRATRRLFVNRLELPDEELMRRAIEDEDSLVRSRAAQTLLARRSDAAGELFMRASGVVRALALENAPAELVLEREQALLLERRATVRHAAQRRLSELGTEVVDRYRGLVGVPSPTPTAIIGLGETGGREDEPRLVKLLEHQDEAVRRAALRALRWIVSEPVLMEMAFRALHDPSDLVVRAAARLLRRRASRIPKDVIDGAVASPSRSTHLAGLWLARRSDGWSRLEADLKLSTDPDEDVARAGREDLVSWVSRVAPTLYSAACGSARVDPFASRSARLEKSLDRNIRFHCGIDS